MTRVSKGFLITKAFPEMFSPTFRIHKFLAEDFDFGVSKNSGTPKWMVYTGKPY